MKQPTPAGRAKAPGKIRRKTREELNEEARDRKQKKKHRGNAAGSRTSKTSVGSKNGVVKQKNDPRLGSKKPVVLLSNQTEPTLIREPVKPEKQVLTPEQELEALENNERLDLLLERLEAGEHLNDEEQTWVNIQLDRIDVLMQQLGLSWDDEEDEDKQEDMMRLLKGNN